MPQTDTSQEAVFTPQGAKRIVGATRWAEKQPTYAPGDDGGRKVDLSPYWAIITDSTVRTDLTGVTGVWYYTVAERGLDVDLSGTQRWVTPTQPKTTTKAINSVEPFPGQTSPVPIGTYVLIKPEYDNLGHVCHAFELPFPAIPTVPYVCSDEEEDEYPKVIGTDSEDTDNATIGAVTRSPAYTWDRETDDPLHRLELWVSIGVFYDDAASGGPVLCDRRVKMTFDKCGCLVRVGGEVVVEIDTPEPCDGV